MGEASLGLTKFFVSNLPERCSSLDIGEFFSAFGNVANVYVARKRDKHGNNFGFVTFKGVKEVKGLEGRLKGVKMGDSKLQVNVAKFAAENAGLSNHPTVSKFPPNVSEQGQRNVFNERDSRSYHEVLGKLKGKDGSANDFGESSGAGGSPVKKLIVVPDRTSSFQDKFGSVVIGKTVDLETLVDMDKLLRIAKVNYSKIQYLGGLFIVLSMPDKEAANSFLKSREVWGPWFSRLEIWGGQSLPMERVAWLSIHDIPLNLLEPDVLEQVGNLFGKVLFVPKDLDEDLDLSVFKVGVLVGDSHRIKGSVSLRWKNRTYRIWVDEDQDAWVPECLVRKDWVPPGGDTLLRSPPEFGAVNSGEEEVDWSRKLVEEGESKQCSVNVDSPPENVCPMQEGYVHEDLIPNAGNNDTVEPAVDPSRKEKVGGSMLHEVGPSDIGYEQWD
ncbi:putative RNA recognition motif domain, nucleotide-binding alpha-beta plait domain superfamily [Helianthus annuus]|nr:putative RNA recognition motif domain, nucleotide-binding alpha-beta plait domain superfamily [Helianthus annuus]KAJ0840126.1 putative RNA recognition motif domain, nucleotide-binding alpha-beta plait domain superfamily [Helianthus annuus]KAJ0853488.1 putative RNA recognition motif domain, nucleotide-binding alpha-beta plait domain superfamily [Helianthus annuus]